MKIDLYTKFALSMIALGLFLNAGSDFIKPAHALMGGSPVEIQNTREIGVVVNKAMVDALDDYRHRHSFKVQCTNCAPRR